VPNNQKKADNFLKVTRMNVRINVRKQCVSIIALTLPLCIRESAESLHERTYTLSWRYGVGVPLITLINGKLNVSFRTADVYRSNCFLADVGIMFTRLLEKSKLNALAISEQVRKRMHAKLAMCRKRGKA